MAFLPRCICSQNKWKSSFWNEAWLLLHLPFVNLFSRFLHSFVSLWGFSIARHYCQECVLGCKNRRPRIDFITMRDIDWFVFHWWRHWCTARWARGYMRCHSVVHPTCPTSKGCAERRERRDGKVEREVAIEMGRRSIRKVYWDTSLYKQLSHKPFRPLSCVLKQENALLKVSPFLIANCFQHFVVDWWKKREIFRTLKKERRERQRCLKFAHFHSS